MEVVIYERGTEVSKTKEKGNQHQGALLIWLLPLAIVARSHWSPLKNHIDCPSSLPAQDKEGNVSLPAPSLIRKGFTQGMNT